MKNDSPITALASAVSLSETTVFIGFIILLLWSLLWKGLALWRAGRDGDKGWFIVLLLLNSAGVLDLFYLYFIKRGN